MTFHFQMCPHIHKIFLLHIRYALVYYINVFNFFFIILCSIVYNNNMFGTALVTKLGRGPNRPITCKVIYNVWRFPETVPNRSACLVRSIDR